MLKQKWNGKLLLVSHFLSFILVYVRFLKIFSKIIDISIYVIGIFIPTTKINILTTKNSYTNHFVKSFLKNRHKFFSQHNLVAIFVLFMFFFFLFGVKFITSINASVQFHKFSIAIRVGKNGNQKRNLSPVMGPVRFFIFYFLLPLSLKKSFLLQ